MGKHNKVDRYDEGYQDGFAAAIDAATGNLDDLNYKRGALDALGWLEAISESLIEEARLNLGLDTQISE